MCCDSWGREESDMTERLNLTARAGDSGLIPGSGNLLEEKMCSLLGLSSVSQAHISLGKLYKL